MSAICLLISLSLLVALGFLVAFIWAVRSGQYEDTQTPSMRILMDEVASSSPASPPAAKSSYLPTEAFPNSRSSGHESAPIFAKTERTHVRCYKVDRESP